MAGFGVPGVIVQDALRVLSTIPFLLEVEGGASTIFLNASSEALLVSIHLKFGQRIAIKTMIGHCMVRVDVDTQCDTFFALAGR